MTLVIPSEVMPSWFLLLGLRILLLLSVLAIAPGLKSALQECYNLAPVQPSNAITHSLPWLIIGRNQSV